MTSETRGLLLSKLKLPSSLSENLPRPRLVKRLNEGLICRATFLTAPAGYGKTTLVGQWASQLDGPVGWISLDERDNDLVRFWNYVIKAMEPVWAESGANLSIAMTTLSPGLYEPFIVSLLNELNSFNSFKQKSPPFVLIFDDWHAIHNTDILESVSYFLEYLPPGVHLCFASRSTGSFLKARWISRGWVREIGAGPLCFDFQETAEYYRLTEKRELHRDLIEGILRQTEGWVSGLKLYSLAIRSGGGPGAMIPRHSLNGSVEQLLFEEVFDSLADPMRRFLLDISVLRQMNHPLCVAVAGEDGAGRLEELISLNLFVIPLDEHGSWYRFHHLFGEFLRNRLERTAPHRINVLYQSAAAWCESQGLLEEAVDYYLAGASYPEAIGLLERMKSLLIRREFSTMKVWLQAIPDDLLMRHPYLYFSYTYSLLWGQEPDLAERYLQQAERHCEANGNLWQPEDKNRFLGYLYYVRNFKATQYDMDMNKGLEYIRLSLKYSPQGTDLIFASPQMPLCPSIYRSYNGKRGKHLPRQLADSFFTNMIEFMKQMGLQDSILVCYGELLYERNELKLAEEYIKTGLYGRSQAHFQPEKVYVPACLFLSRIGKAQRDMSQAEQWLEEAYRRAVKDGAQEALILIEAEMALLWLDQGDGSKAAEWRERYGISPEDPVSVYQLFVYICLVRLLIETGNIREAWSLSERLLSVAIKGYRPMDALDLLILQAMMLRLEDRPQEAILKLEEALKYAEPDDYVRVFTDKGGTVAEMLADYVEHRQKGNLRDKNAPTLSFVRKIMMAFEGAGEQAFPGRTTLEMLLTPRELTIFRCMEEGMDNKAIVDTLGIGMGTLKAHINHIYSKLQVKNRIEAIKRGKELQV
ncbi:LuxR C-terminal-related transcriptional regulator [Paenibacillus sp. M1]|uniref:LuxR C-terminal-related transcriptional regulator n=1 Tax=Paenibacillus haidiansis TaxID=1574488 RepID=A0ABU7VPL2_9BACL